jgi:hemoglobin-like flavoprotein
MNPLLVTQSLELAGERCADITPLVYAKLFAQHPDMKPLFVRDTNGSVRGEMLFKVIEAILDFIGARAYSNHLIQTEVVTHEGYGVPREVFGVFFGTLRDTLRDVLADDWTKAMEESWRDLLAQLDTYVRNSDQTAA